MEKFLTICNGIKEKNDEIITKVLKEQNERLASILEEAKLQDGHHKKLETQLEGKNKVISRNEASITGMKTEISGANEKICKLENTLKEKETALLESNQQIELLNETSKDLSARVEERNGQIKEKDGKILILEKQLKTAKAQNKTPAPDLKSALDLTQAKVVENYTTIQSLQNEIKNQKSQSSIEVPVINAGSVEINAKTIDQENSIQFSPGPITPDQHTPEQFKRSKAVSVAELMTDIDEKKNLLTEKDETISSLKKQLENVSDADRMQEIMEDLKVKNAKLRKNLQSNIQGATQLLKGINTGKVQQDSTSVSLNQISELNISPFDIEE